MEPTHTLSEFDLARLLQDEGFRLNNGLPNVSYDVEKKLLVISDHIIVEICKLETDGELRTLSFVDCQFGQLQLRGDASDMSKTYFFGRCSFDTIHVYGDPRLFLWIEDSLKLEKLLVTGDLRSLLLTNLGDEANEISNLQIGEEIYDGAKHPAVHEVMISGQPIYDLWIGQTEKSEVRITKSRVHRLDYLPEYDNKLFVNGGCSIEAMRIFSHVGNLVIRDSEFASIIFLPDSSKIGMADGHVTILHATIRDLEVDGGANLGALKIGENCKVGNINLKEGALRSVDINCLWVGRLRVDIGKFRFDQLLVSSSDMNVLHINRIILHDGYLGKGPASQPAVIQFLSFTFSYLMFNSFTNQGNVFISNVRVMPPVFSEPPWLLANERQDEGDKILCLLDIVNSDLGKINFISCDFGAARMYFDGSKVLEVFLASTTMPKQISGDLQLAYGQIKKIFENRGDSVNSMEYLKLELDSHFDVLDNIPRGERTKEMNREWLILFLSKYSNRFGTSFHSWRIVLIVMIGFFCVHNLMLCYYPKWPVSTHDFDTFLTILSLFPEFLYPIHKADFIADELGVNVTPVSRVIDFLGRIVSGYFIYQYIQVFRKYGKK